VRSGESLWSIAHRYHLPIEQLRRANGLDAKAIVHPGQVLGWCPDRQTGAPCLAVWLGRGQTSGLAKD
jgi:hypothetical protein